MLIGKKLFVLIFSGAGTNTIYTSLEWKQMEEPGEDEYSREGTNCTRKWDETGPGGAGSVK